jgi:hypothetical protein
MQNCIGVVLLGWYLLLPHRDDGPPGTNQPASFEKWHRVGAYDSALGCELARQARIGRDRTLLMTAVCVMSEEPRKGPRPAPVGPGGTRDEPGGLSDPAAGDQ